MDESDKEVPQVSVSAETVLRSTSEEYKRLRHEAGEALDRGDLKMYQERLIKAGQLVAGLDAKLKEDTVDSSRLSEDDRSKITFFSTTAKEWVDKRNFFGMSAVFDRMGSKKGDPNDLEKLVERVYPAQKPTEKPQP